MTQDFVDLLKTRMEQAERSIRDQLPVLFLRNPTPTRQRIERSKLPPKIARYRKRGRYNKIGVAP